MNWNDYKKAHDVAPHSWLKEAVELVKLAKNVKKHLFDW